MYYQMGNSYFFLVSRQSAMLGRLGSVGGSSGVLARPITTGVRILFDSEERLRKSGILLDTLGFEQVSAISPTSSSYVSGSRRYQHYGLNLDLVVNSQLGKLRSVVSSGSPFAHVLGIEFYPALINPYLKDEDGLGMIDLLTLGARGASKKKTVPMNVHHDCDETAPRFSKSTSGEQALGIVRPREIVIPLREDDTVSASMSAFGQLDIQPLGSKLPGLFKSKKDGDDLVFRLVPCTNVGLMLQVKSIENAESFLSEKGIPYERLGNELSQRELQVLDPSLTQAIDIRLSEQQTPNLFWREGSSSILGATTMQSMHNSRVLAGKDAGEGGEEKAELDSRNLNSDCWVETRERVKTGVLR